MFGLDRKTIANFEEHPANTPNFIDCIQKGKFMIEMKSLGYNLYKAMSQAMGYYSELKQKDLPRYVLACDFQTGYLLDKEDNSEYHFELAQLVNNIGLFGFMTDRPQVIRSDPVNIKASEILGKIFDALKESGYPHHQVEYFLTRLVFCLFADDTGIFGDNGKFQTSLKKSTVEDGSDLGRYLTHLFAVLNKKRDERMNITQDTKINAFPYINGALFEKPIEFPSFDSKMRQLLIDAGNYDWAKVSPAIFGNMFQTVMDQDTRREMGAHYTSEENILKVIKPLFLDDLNKEFNELFKVRDDSRKDKFRKFQNKLANLKFFDPACGSGNFLVIAYREVRRLEHMAIMEIYGYEGDRMDTDDLSLVNVDQFYGIEMIEFSARIAEISLWMMDHIMNRELSDRYGYIFRRIPLKKKPNIVWRDALEFDWNELIPANQCSYIFGNPPFGGSKVLTSEQREQIKRIADLGQSGGTLDYVCSWFLKAGQYVNEKTLIGFVSTNSITQGEQVAQLWETLQDKLDLNIIFAYKQFKWNSESKGKAQVTVIILGLRKNNNDNISKRLFYYRDGVEDILEENPEYISPYLIGSSKKLPIVKETSKPLNGLPKIQDGAVPLDGGNLTFTKEQKDALLVQEPNAEKWLRPFIDAKSFINGKTRWVLYLEHIVPHELKKLPEIMKCVNATKKYRFSSSRKGTKDLADAPTKFAWGLVPSKTFLIMPRVTSERREYVPFGYLKPPIIPSNAMMIIEDISLGLFGLLTSKMHMVWIRTVGGKLETRLRYSAGMIYNTFPIPHTNYDSLKPYVENILNIRAKYPESTLADLYDPVTMPSDLKKAHQRLDREVEKLYRTEPFTSDQQRIEFLLEEYQKMVEGHQTTLS